MCPIEDSLSKNPFFEHPLPTGSVFAEPHPVSEGTSPPILGHRLQSRRGKKRSKEEGPECLSSSPRPGIASASSAAGAGTGKQTTVPFHPGNLTETVPLSLAHEQTMLSVTSFPRSSQKDSSCKGTVSNPGRKANEEGFKPTFLRTNCWRPSREKQYTLPEIM